MAWHTDGTTDAMFGADAVGLPMALPMDTPADAVGLCGHRHGCDAGICSMVRRTEDEILFCGFAENKPGNCSYLQTTLILSY